MPLPGAVERKQDTVFVAWRDLRFAKGRFALMGSVVILITMLVTLLSGLTAGLSLESISAVTGLPADHLAFAAPANGQKASFTDSTVTADQWDRWSEAPGVSSAQPIGIATTRVTAGPRTAALSAFGVRPGSQLAPDPAGVRDGQVVLSTAAAKALGVTVGGSVTVAGDTRTVAAVAGDASYSHTPVLWTSLSDWQRLSPGSGPQHATVIALTTAPGAELAATDRALGTYTMTRDASVSAIGSYTSENGSLQLMRGFLFAISALVIGAFFTVWTIQRSGDVAVLKALGASTSYLLRDALGQAVVLLTAGTAAGAALAAAAGVGLSGAVPFVVNAGTTLFPAAVMIAIGAAGAALSIRRITSVDPLTALGSTR